MHINTIKNQTNFLLESFNKYPLVIQRKKIAMIALFAIACLLAAYAWVRIGNWKIKNGSVDEREEESDNEQKTRIKNHPIPQMETSLTDSTCLSALNIKNIQVQSAKCFINIKFENGEIKKEFIIKNLANVSINENFMTQQADKIRQCMEACWQDNFGMCKLVQTMTLFKDTRNKFHSQFNDKDYWAEDRYNGGSDWKTNLNTKELLRDYQTIIIDQMHFPKEQQIKNGEFVPGTFYQVLN